MRQYLEGLKTPEGIDETLTQVKRIRDKLVAHLDKDYALDDNLRSQASTTFKRLESLLEEANGLLAGLFIGGGRAMLPIDYINSVQRREGMEHTSDIEHTLDLLAKDSRFLYMPEEQPNLWSLDAPKLTPWQKQRFNYYRKRVGLSEVKFD